MEKNSKKKKKKITSNDVIEIRKVIEEYLETGFISGLTERNSQKLAKEKFADLFSYIEDLNPRVKREKLIKGHENELSGIKFNINKVLTSFDACLDYLRLEKPNYKVNPIHTVKAKSLCQKMYLRIKKNGGVNLTPEYVVSRVCDLLETLKYSSWISGKFSLSYIDSTFDDAINEANSVRNKRRAIDILKGL